MVRRTGASRVAGMRPGVRYGVIFGAVGFCLALLALFLTFKPGWIITCGIFIVTLGLSFEAGRWTTERTGTTRSGILAGAVAGLMSGIGLSIEGLVITLNKQSTTTPSPQGVVVAIAFVLEIIIVGGFFLGAGTGLGWYGALLGKRHWHDRAPVERNSGQPPRS